MIQIHLTVGQSFPIGVTPTPAGAALDAPPTYAVVAGDVLKIAPAADGLSAVAQAVAPGKETITVKGVAAGAALVGDDEIVVTVTEPPAKPGLHVTVGKPA